jgi:hypothetical protein
MAIIDDLEQIAALVSGVSGPPVVEDERSTLAICPCQNKGGEQARHAMVGGG